MQTYITIVAIMSTSIFFVMVLVYNHTQHMHHDTHMQAYMHTRIHLLLQYMIRHSCYKLVAIIVAIILDQTLSE